VTTPLPHFDLGPFEELAVGEVVDDDVDVVLLTRDL
jgi:hypothetical protein